MTGQFLQNVGTEEAPRWRLIRTQVCTSLGHAAPQPAVAVLHLVQGPTPYCLACAEQMLHVYRVLGTHCHVEPLPPEVLREAGGGPERAIGLRP